ncbi:hypothetical protein SDC9_183934 [bioreactor metagenome]|uniref:Uncharacterized protein n=1 Tax=bioreactor metagenome TaxID=1076179 RepID=A0A645HBM5_9ZZZZ
MQCRNISSQEYSSGNMAITTEWARGQCLISASVSVLMNELGFDDYLLIGI